MTLSLLKACALAIIALTLTCLTADAAPVATSLYGAAHGIPSGLSTLYVIDATTGQATAIGPIGFTRVSAMAFHPTSAVLYAVGRRPGTDTSVLITIDLATGAGTEVGPTGVDVLGFGPNVSDIAFRPSDGVLFAYLEAGDGVGTIDITTGAATALGPSNSNGCCGNGIAFSAGGVLFHATDTPLNTLDQTTGQATEVVATLAYPAPADSDPRINAMDFHPATGALFGSLNDGNPGQPENYLATVDTATGVVTIVARTVNGLDALAWGPQAVVVARDHVLCYKTKAAAPFEKRDVELEDQFQASTATVLKSQMLCTPTNRDNTGVTDPQTHLMAYQIKGGAHEKTQVRVASALGAILELETIKPDRILVPAAKSLTTPPSAPDNTAHDVDHFQCYKVKLLDGNPARANIEVEDQFQHKFIDVKKVTRLCAPVDKNGEGIKDAPGHRLCYAVKLVKGEPKHTPVEGVQTNDQFDPQELETVKDVELCVPATKELIP